MEASSSVPDRSHDEFSVEHIATAVAREKGCGPLDLPPLYDEVDPDALARLVSASGVTEVSFAYCGCRVSVDGDGGVRVTDE